MSHPLLLSAGIAALAISLASCSRVKTQTAVPAPPARDADLHEDNPFEAAEYFREQRVMGEGLLPIERYQAALRHASTMRRYSLRNLPSETERYLAGIDAYLKSGNNLFVSDEPEALLSVRHNRVGRCNGGPLRGRVDTLVVILPPQTDPRPKLASFVDYRATCWNSCNVHGWVIWWQGRDDLGKLPTREASDRSLPTPKQS